MQPSLETYLRHYDQQIDDKPLRRMLGLKFFSIKALKKLKREFEHDLEEIEKELCSRVCIP